MPSDGQNISTSTNSEDAFQSSGNQICSKLFRRFTKWSSISFPCNQVSERNKRSRKGKHLNIDLNQMSQRRLTKWLKQYLDFRSLDRSERRPKIWVSLSYKTVNIVVSSLCYLNKNVKSVIDSAVLHWTTRLMVFPRNVGFGWCYLVSTRH